MGYKIKKYGLVLGDVVCILISFALALLLRFEFSMSRALPYWYTTIGRLPRQVREISKKQFAGLFQAPSVGPSLRAGTWILHPPAP